MILTSTASNNVQAKISITMFSNKLESKTLTIIFSKNLQQKNILQFP